MGNQHEKLRTFSCVLIVAMSFKVVINVVNDQIWDNVTHEQCVGLIVKLPIHVMIRFSQSLSCKHELALLQTFPKFNHQDYSIKFFMVMISK